MQNIVVTTFNDSFDYFRRGLSLISEIHATSFETVDKILVYDLGLSKHQVKFLENIQKVEVRSYPETLYTSFFPEFMHPKEHGYKCFVLDSLAEQDANFFWLDSGIIPLKNLAIAFDIIDKDEILFVGNHSSLTNEKWTQQIALEIMNATEEEKKAIQVSSGILGFKGNGKYIKLLKEAYEFSQIKDILVAQEAHHRHDQSIYGILAKRYNCQLQDVEKWGQWRGIVYDDQVLYVSRGEFKTFDNIRYKLPINWLDYSNIKVKFDLIRISLYKNLKSLIKKALRR